MTSVAILVPAHNEQESIDACLASAVRGAGRDNVYLVSDNSTDRTTEYASYWTDNILEVSRGGKAQAVRAAVEHFGLTDRYDGVLVVDADSKLKSGAMAAYRRSLHSGVAAVIGRMEVLPEQRGIFAAWRRHQYLYLTALYMRGFAFWGKCFPVTPGFCTLYASDALKQFGHDPDAPTEDIDWAWEIHRKRMGEIVYEPKAVVETSVPETLTGYVKQTLRWNRGWHYATRKHRMPLGHPVGRPQWVDLAAGIMTAEMLLVWLRFFVGLAALPIYPGVALFLALTFCVDFSVQVALAVGGAALSGRFWRAAWAPAFPALYVLDAAVNFYAFVNLRGGLSAIWEPPREKREKEVTG